MLGTRNFASELTSAISCVAWCISRAAAYITDSARSPSATAVPSVDRAANAPPARRPMSERLAANSSATPIAWSAAPTERGVVSGRVSWRLFSTVSRPWPGSPTSISASRTVRRIASPLMSAPRVPCVATFGRYASVPESTRCLSRRTRESDLGPGWSEVRASTVIARPRVALLMGHFSPSSTTRSPRAAVVAVFERSEPRPRSVSPHETGPPSSTSSAMVSAIGPPVIHAPTAPRKVTPCATATVRSRRAMLRIIIIGTRKSRSSPPCASGTYHRCSPRSFTAAIASTGNSRRSSSSTDRSAGMTDAASRGSPRNRSNSRTMVREARTVGISTTAARPAVVTVLPPVRIRASARSRGGRRPGATG